jgi:hypothetical protein
MTAPEYDFKKIYDEYFRRIVQYLTKIVGPNDAVEPKIDTCLWHFEGKCTGRFLLNLE